MSQTNERLYEFGHFRVDPVKRLLHRDGAAVSLTAKVFDTLLLLIERRGEVVSKDEMMRLLWRDTVVEENNLTQQVSALRRALGERAGEHRYVVTVPGRGYSFVANVREVRGESLELMTDDSARTSARAAVEVEGRDAGEGRDARERLSVAHRAPKLVPRAPARRPLLYGACAALVAALAVFSYGWRGRRAQPAATVPRSLAVLPFRSLNAAGDDALLGAGMTDTLIAKLSNARQLGVRPTSAVIKYAGKDADTLAAGRALGVDSVLEGTVQEAGERVRVTVQLLDVGDGSSLWAQSFDARLDDIFAVQDSISEQVTRAMLARLSRDDERRLRKHHTEDFQAYQMYLRGRFFWNKRSREGLAKSVEYFERAVRLDPDYALAYAGIADAYNILGSYGLAEPSADESARRARAAADRALEIDEALPEAHASLGSIRLYHDGDPAGAEGELRRAVELNPSYATAHHWLADCLAMLGRQDEAFEEITRAQQLDPLSPVIGTTLAERLFYARRYDESIAQLRQTLEIEPDFLPARYVLGLAYEAKGMYGEAIGELERAKALSGDRTPFVVSALAHTYAVSGRREDARRVLGELFKFGDATYEIATVYTGLGERRLALAWLGRVEARRARWLLETDPRLDSLRSDPKFQVLLRA
jgi:TolB-like protein/DNA-binding winged helix-turn-helix (wHTH) protein/tetratricopeptide (TPR) repeat protein